MSNPRFRSEKKKLFLNRPRYRIGCCTGWEFARGGLTALPANEKARLNLWPPAFADFFYCFASLVGFPLPSRKECFSAKEVTTHEWDSQGEREGDKRKEKPKLESTEKVWRCWSLVGCLHGLERGEERVEFSKLPSGILGDPHQEGRQEDCGVEAVWIT